VGAAAARARGGARRPAPRPRPAVLDDVPLRVDRDEVLRFQGYKKGVDVPDAAVLALFEEALGLSESLIEPRVVYRTVKVTAQSADLLEAGGQSLHIPEIGRLWGSLEEIGAGVCTICAPLGRGGGGRLGGGGVAP